jgi:hypothetical protein
MTVPPFIRRVLPCLLCALSFVPLSGCLVVSLHPVYDKGSVTFREPLVGVWKSAEDDEVLTIERGAWNAYDVTFQEGPETKHVTGHLTQIGPALVLDVTTATGVEEPMVTVQAHWAFLVEQQADRLSLRALDYDWFSAHLSDKAIAGTVPVLDGDQNIVLTASTAQLRAWLSAHAATADVWEDPITFSRQPAASAPDAAVAQPPRETEPVIDAYDGDDYTRYELLDPASAQFRIVYEVTATQAGARYYFNAIRKGSEASDEVVYDRSTGQKLPFTIVPGAEAKAAGLASADADTHYIQVTLPRPVPVGGEVRLRIDKTYKDPRSYFSEGSAIVFSRSLGIRRNAVVLPKGYELVACNVPSQVVQEPDGRIRASFVHTGAGPAPLVIRGRSLPPAAGGAAVEPPSGVRPQQASGAQPASSPSMAARLDERARQDREIVYFLQQPETHAFSLYHDYTERRAGTDKYLNVVRAGSRASNPSARLLDTGEALKVETLKGDAITRAALDIGEPVRPETEVVVIRFPVVQPGQSSRLRIQETYTDEGRYYLDGDELVWDRALGRPRNAVVLPSGWYVTASSIPAVVTMTQDGRVRLDYDNPRPDEVAVLLKARRR